MLKQEFLKIIRRRSYVNMFLVLFIAAIGDFLCTCQFWYGQDKISVYSANMQFLLNNSEPFVLKMVYFSLFPLIVSIAVSDVYDRERENGTTNLIFTRISKRKNIRNKAWAVSIAALFLVAIPLVMNAVLCLCAFPKLGVRMDSPVYMRLVWAQAQPIWPKWTVLHPYRAAWLYIVGRCLMAIVFALFSFAVSVWYQKNRYVCLLSSFLLATVYAVFCTIFPGVSNDIYNTFLQNNGVDIAIFLSIVFFSALFILWRGSRKEELA